MCADIHFLSLAADLPKTVSPSLTGGVVLPPVAGDFVDQRAGDRDADGAGCGCLLYTSPSPRDRQKSRMPSSA